MPDDDKKKKKKNNPNRGLDYESGLSLYGYDPANIRRASMRKTNDVFGSLDVLEPGERQRMKLLQMKRQQAEQPLNTPQPGSRRIGYNPYSVSLAPLESGVYNALEALIVNDRQDVLFGDEETYQKFQTKADRRRAEAQQLMDEANQTLSVDRKGYVMAENYDDVSGLMGATGGVADDQLRSSGAERTIALEQKREAKRLMREADKYEEQAKSARGVIPELSELEARQENAQRQVAARQEFAGNLYEDTVDQLESQQEFKDEKELDQQKADNQLKLAKERTRRALGEARIKASGKENGDGSDGEVDIPAEFTPDIIQEETKNYRDATLEEIEKLKDPDNHSNRTEDNPDQLKPEISRKVQQLEEQADLLNEIKVLSQIHNERDTDEIPEPSYPTSDQNIDIMRMESLGIPRGLIDAYKYYNGIDEDAIPDPNSESSNVPDITNF